MSLRIKINSTKAERLVKSFSQLRHCTKKAIFKFKHKGSHGLKSERENKINGMMQLGNYGGAANMGNTF